MSDQNDHQNEMGSDAHGAPLTGGPNRTDGRDGPGVFVPPPLLFGGAAAAGVILDGSAPGWPPLADPLRFAGILGALSGLVLIVICLGLFRRFQTRPEPWQPDQALIASGVYRFSRIPMYLGMALLCLGIAMLFKSLVGIILVGIAFVVIDRYVVAREEAYLARRFGSKYDAYRAKVRRWF